MQQEFVVLVLPKKPCTGEPQAPGYGTELVTFGYHKTVTEGQTEQLFRSSFTAEGQKDFSVLLLRGINGLKSARVYLSLTHLKPQFEILYEYLTDSL